MEHLLASGVDQPSIVEVVLGGERLSPKLARTVRENFPRATIRNLYGPTETTVDAIGFTLDETTPDVVPIAPPPSTDKPVIPPTAPATPAR